MVPVLKNEAKETIEVGVPGSSEFEEPHQPMESWNIEVKKDCDDTTEWVKSMEAKIQHVCGEEVRLHGDGFMPRIPKYIREGKLRDAYNPLLVSLGPYTHGNEVYKDMEIQKWRALNQVLKRNNQDLGIYFNAIKEIEKKARSCYEGPISLSVNEFVRMMVLDGCFLLEILQGYYLGFKNLGYPSNDLVFASREINFLIRQDVLVLENQLPLFILVRLYSLQKPNAQAQLLNMIVFYFCPFLMISRPDDLSEKEGVESLMNCIDVFRHSLLRHDTSSVRRIIDRRIKIMGVKDKKLQQLMAQRLLPCATDLRRYGIKFEKRNTHRFWDIEYKNGSLQIPQIKVHVHAKMVLLNLIGLEQYNPGCSSEISSYVTLMGILIQSSQDVAYLHKKGIIEHFLSNYDDVADVFKQLSQMVIFENHDNYLPLLLNQLREALQRSKWNRLHWNRVRENWNISFTILKDNYFKNRWALISFLAAVGLLLLTFAQTFYGVYGYYNPRK